MGGGGERRGLTLDGGGTAFDVHEDKEDRVGDAVVEHVALPLELDLAALVVADRDAAHDEVRGDDGVVGALFLEHVDVFGLDFAVGKLLDEAGGRGGGELLDGAERAFERPLDEVDAGGRQPEALLAGDGRRRQAGVLAQVLGGHERHFKVVLHKHARDELRLVDARVHGVTERGRDGGEPADYLGRLVLLEGDAELLAVSRAKDLDLAGLVGVEGEELGLETHHVVHLAVDQNLGVVRGQNGGQVGWVVAYDDRSGHLLDELSVLDAVDVGGKGVLLYRAAAGNHDLLGVTTGAPSRSAHVPRHDRLDLIGLLHDLLGHCPFNAVTGDDDTVLLAGCPSLEQLAADAVLQHTRASKHDTAAHVVEAINVLEGADELEVPGTALSSAVARRLCFSHALPEQALDVVVHGADVRLVDKHTFPCQVAGIVDGKLLKVAVLGPVLVEDEQQLLCATEGENGHEHAAATVEDARDGLHERLLPLDARHVRGDAVGGFGDEDVYLDAPGHLGRHEMAILLARVVTREEDVEPCDFDEEHGGAQDVASGIGGDADGRDGVCRVVVDGLDLRECVEMVLLGVDELRSWVGRRVADAYAVLDEPLVDGLGWMGHEDAASEVGLGQDIGEGGGMVDMETVPSQQ